MKIFISSILLSLFVNTASFAMASKPSTPERISQGVHGVALAIEKGRIDSASSIIKETTKVTAPPKRPLKILEIADTVILPPNLSGRKVINVDSTEYKLLLQDRATRKSLETSLKEQRRYANNVLSALKEQEQAKLNLKEDLARAERLIVKKEKTIKELTAFRNIVLSVAGLVIALIALYTASLFIRALPTANRYV